MTIARFPVRSLRPPESHERAYRGVARIPPRLLLRLGTHPDVWVQLCRAAERTTRIASAPGSSSRPAPSDDERGGHCHAGEAYRHGAGGRWGRVWLHGSHGMGQRACVGVTWPCMCTLRGLLRGEQIRWDGKLIQMLHTPASHRPTAGGALHHCRRRPTRPRSRPRGWGRGYSPRGGCRWAASTGASLSPMVRCWALERLRVPSDPSRPLATPPPCACTTVPSRPPGHPCIFKG